MAQIFHPSANTLARLSIFGGAFIVLGALVLTYMVIRSPYQTDVHVVKAQPVPFSHEHHVNGLGIDAMEVDGKPQHRCPGCGEFFGSKQARGAHSKFCKKGGRHD